MTDRPEPFATLDTHFAASTLRHEYLSDLYREMVARGELHDVAREILRESVRIATVELPALTADIRELETSWRTQILLDPAAAADTAAAAEQAASAIQSRLRAIADRHDQLVREMQALAGA